jgi:uroporphyrinogen decarboxylase
MPQDQHLAMLAGYDRFETVGVNLSLLPGFEEETLQEDAEYRVYRTGDGVVKKIRKDAVYPAMPQYVRFPLLTRDDWKEFKKKLDSESPARLPAHWESVKKQYQNRDFPLGVSAGSMFGWLRNWMGVEHVTVMLYDDPKWVHEMMECLADHFVAVLKKVVFDVDFDFAVMWEDMAYKTGSLISPKHVREFMVPNYKKVTALLHKAGIDTIMLDSDGNVDELIPLWLECGINYIYPFEVAAGMDVVQLRKKYGKDLIMGGGMDKRVMASDKRTIRKMIMEKKSLLEQGGYVPGCDHAMPPDISWENFMYYRKLLNEF